MAYVADLERLTEAFAGRDARTPALVFGLLGLFFTTGPFPFNAEDLSARLNETNLKARINPYELAALQDELAPFFDDTGVGWAPSARLFAQS